MTLFLLFLLLWEHFVVGAWMDGYKRAWFGPIVHVIGGLFLASLTGSFLASLLLATLWEGFEWGFDTLFPKHSNLVCWYSRSWGGAVRDVLFTSLGAFIFLFLYA